MPSTSKSKRTSRKKMTSETAEGYFSGNKIKNHKIDGLSDSVFAIAMVILAFDLRIPVLNGIASDAVLLHAIGSLMPIFLSYGLTFALLFTYWRSHHFLTSVYAKNMTVGLANYNIMFFFFIAILPFSARLLGEYSYSYISILFYGLNVICVGLALLAMRSHIASSSKIDTAGLSRADLRGSYIRIMVPIISAILAIIFSLDHPELSMGLFVFIIVFNMLPASINIIHHFVDRVVDDGEDYY